LQKRSFTPGKYLLKVNSDSRCLHQKPEERTYPSWSRVVVFNQDHSTSLTPDGPTCGASPKWEIQEHPGLPGEPSDLHFNNCQDGFTGRIFSGNIVMGAWDGNDGCFRLDPAQQ
jgi:hypothetical protein